MKLPGPVFSKVILVLVGVYVVFGSLTQCVGFRDSNKSIEKEFNDKKLQPEFLTYTVNGHKMYFTKIGSDTLPMVLFVHGSPGSWNAFKKYFEDNDLASRACLVSVDRAGYGQSNAGIAEPDMEQQAALIAPLLTFSKSPAKPVLVGHSLGGPIIARLAMDNPGKVGSLLFLAPSIDPAMEKNEWWRKILKTGIVRSVMPADFVSSNLELIPLKGELEKMKPLWTAINVPCTIIHGTGDKLVPYGNVAFYKEMLVNAPQKEVVTLENVNHFIPWSHYDTVKNAIIRHLDKSW
jgi:pimeloyl-ACP methyl ester carboxylesterase